jgi:hypothetical protein
MAVQQAMAGPMQKHAPAEIEKQGSLQPPEQTTITSRWLFNDVCAFASFTPGAHLS